MTRVLVFDLDDTLFPEWQYVLSGFRAVDQHLSRSTASAPVLIPPSAFYNAAKSLFDAGSRGNIFDLALKQLNLSTLAADKNFIADLVRIYREHKPTLTLHADARWAIDYFRARGHILALLSDGYLIAQQNKLAALKIARHFAAVVFSDALGRDAWKPSPLPYQKIMSEIPGLAADFTYIADNPKKDFITPRKLGWSTIHIDRPDGTYHSIEVPSEYHADKTISDLKSLNVL